ncbi:MAG: aspartyl protease family protein [Rikenellaceae bacterium]|nr:aspartyl protease family protein [Rikenellaceae bacterium]
MPCAVNLTGDKEISGQVIMDTGANYYLILFSSFVRKNRLLLSGFQPESQSATVSLGVTTPVYNGRAAELRLGPELYYRDVPITLQASSSGESNRENLPDGSLGVGFFSRYNFTINLLQQRICLRPRSGLEP